MGANADAGTIDITVAVARAKGEDFHDRAGSAESPQGDQVRVQILATALCHTDLIVRDQYYPVPLGAEAAELQRFRVSGVDGARETVDSFDLAVWTGSILVAPTYRRAPEDRFPAAHDGYAALK